MGCTLVAGKVEECSRRVRDIVNTFHWLLQDVRSVSPKCMMDYIADEYYMWRDRITTVEMHILRDLGFHVQPRQPVGLLANYLNALELSDDPRLSQRAINYINDGMRGVVAVCHQPHVIACAAIELAAEDLKVELPEEPRWYRVFDVERKDLEEASRLIKIVYETVTSPKEIPLDANELGKYNERMHGGTLKDISENRPSSLYKTAEPAALEHTQRPRSPSRSRERARSRERSRQRSRDGDRYRSGSRRRDYHSRSRSRSRDIRSGSRDRTDRSNDRYRSYRPR